MRYLLLADHYCNDMIMPSGTYVGVPGDEKIQAYWVEPDGKTPRAPSREMEPLDEAAKAAMKERFKDYPSRPASDPTALIPIQGTGSGAYAPGVIPPADRGIKPMSPIQQAPSVAAAPKSASSLPAQKPGSGSVSQMKDK